MGFKFNPFTGTLDIVAQESGNNPSVTGNIKIEHRIISGAEFNNQSITLAETPLNSSEVALDIPEGTSQVIGLDYTISGNVLSWEGFALETILTENDNLRITYQF